MSKNRLKANNNNNYNDETSLPFSYLPDDVRQEELYPRSPLAVLGLLAQTSHQYETETAFLRLLTSAVSAEPESYKQADKTKLAAIAILKRHPELLFRTSKVIDHFAREIRASPYRLFLGAGDVWAIKQVHEEIIAKIKDKKARVQAEAQAQVEFQTQFPNCPWPFDPNMPENILYDKRNKKQIEQVKAQLKIIIEKITADPCPNGKETKEETTKAVADLCKIFAPKEGEVIKTGLHFPLGIFKEIIKTYNAQFNPWFADQLAFFSRTVIGGTLAAFSAIDGQCVKNGLANLNMKKGPDRRDGLFCRHPKGIPHELAPLAGKLGHTMFVDPHDGYSCFMSNSPWLFDWYNKNAIGMKTTRSGSWARWRQSRANWRYYEEQKLKCMQDIMRTCIERSLQGDENNRSIRCVIL